MEFRESKSYDIHMFISKFYQNLYKIGWVEAIQNFCKVALIEKWALYNRAQICNKLLQFENK